MNHEHEQLLIHLINVQGLVLEHADEPIESTSKAKPGILHHLKEAVKWAKKLDD